MCLEPHRNIMIGTVKKNIKFKIFKRVEIPNCDAIRLYKDGITFSMPTAIPR